MKDFTLQTYKLLLTTLQKQDYSFFTFSDWCKKKSSEKIVILRHDIDKKPENALKVAQIENELGIKASYYFLIKDSVFKSGIIKKIENLGHEVAYHYRDLVDAKGDEKQAFVSFQNNLEKFRSIVAVETIAMDGCPWSKHDNRDLWKNYNYRDFGIIGEPYFDFLNKASGGEVLYFTDTARMWDGDKYNVRDKAQAPSNSPEGLAPPNLPEGEASRFSKDSITKDIVDETNFTSSPLGGLRGAVHSTFDLINWIQNSDNQKPIMITTHPQRWTDNKIEWFMELLSQSIKNKIKQALFAKK